MRASPGHAQRVGTVYVVRVKVLPDTAQIADRRREILRKAGQRRRVDRAGGGAADDGKRIAGLVRQNLGNAFEHADLIRRARPASGKDQARAVVIAASTHGLSGWYVLTPQYYPRKANALKQPRTKVP